MTRSIRYVPWMLVAGAVVGTYGCAVASSPGSNDNERSSSAAVSAPKAPFMTPPQVVVKYKALRDTTRLAPSRVLPGAGVPTATSHAHVYVDPETLFGTKASRRSFNVTSPQNEGRTADATKGDVDLRDTGVAILDQGHEGSCTAYAVAGIMDILAHAHDDVSDISAQEIWFVQGQVAEVYAAADAAQSTWLVPTSVWGNDAFTPEPSGNYQSKGRTRISSYGQVNSGVAEAKAVLGAGHPVLLGLVVNSSWEDDSLNGVIDSSLAPMSGGGHAISLVGYHVDAQVGGGGYFILKNSWGTAHGDNGYYYLPFDYCSNQDGYAEGGCEAYDVAGILTNSAVTP